MSTLYPSNTGILIAFTKISTMVCFWLPLALLAGTDNNSIPKYTITDLGTIGGPESGASAISNKGLIAGWTTNTSSERRAFLFSHDTMQDIGTLPGGTFSQATSINELGQITGYGGINEPGPGYREVSQAFIWDNGSIRSLGALYCPCSYNIRYGISLAHAINSRGQVVGESETVRGGWVRHAFLWQDGVMRDIGGGSGDWSISRALDINDQGQVVGDFARDAGRLWSYNRRAFLWYRDERVDLGTLRGHTSSSAQAINELGWIVGWSATIDGSQSRAVLWKKNKITNLGVLPGNENSEALGINSHGAIVGWSGNSEQNFSRAFLWSDGRMIYLGDTLPSNTGWILLVASSINDNGSIVGTGLYNGQQHAYLLSAIGD